MGPEINIERIEVVNNESYQINFINEDTGQMYRCFIRRDAMFTMLATAEHSVIERGPMAEIKNPPKRWWTGDARVEPLMKPVREGLYRNGINGNAFTDIYNRAYEAVYHGIKNYEGIKRGTS